MIEDPTLAAAVAERHAGRPHWALRDVRRTGAACRARPGRRELLRRPGGPLPRPNACLLGRAASAPSASALVRRPPAGTT
ncbi:hypothetical protein SNL152K_1100 [Streptomyces sp. NL15-2K]|nr:hypothetical protein SNL152K_1100 [Streptomyces sp. NL15-2K]